MLNKVQLIGRLGKDPELRYTASGQAVAGFTLATTDKYKDQQGKLNEVTEWHNIVVWGPQADNCAKYLSKGKLAFLEGKLKTRSYDDKNTNQKRYVTEVVANQVIFLSPSDFQQGQQQHQKPQGQHNNQPQNYQNQQYPPATRPANQPYIGGNTGAPQSNPAFPPQPSLDDIPF